MADVDAPLEQNILDLSQRQRIADIHHHHEASSRQRYVMSVTTTARSRSGSRGSAFHRSAMAGGKPKASRISGALLAFDRQAHPRSLQTIPHTSTPPQTRLGPLWAGSATVTSSSAFSLASFSSSLPVHMREMARSFADIPAGPCRARSSSDKPECNRPPRASSFWEDAWV